MGTSLRRCIPRCRNDTCGSPKTSPAICNEKKITVQCNVNTDMMYQRLSWLFVLLYSCSCCFLMESSSWIYSYCCCSCWPAGLAYSTTAGERLTYRISGHWCRRCYGRWKNRESRTNSRRRHSKSRCTKRWRRTRNRWRPWSLPRTVIRFWQRHTWTRWKGSKFHSFQHWDRNTERLRR